ncbi:type IV pilin-like G/H family protein [Lusitaniella coriacea LEGE 07157]|uniref:Type IV pilin-like G/H family protein n=1 Tax=Lusitaniella coriacea LEGE 07157 TaxID=945747 RepID=A0A8J7B8P0_9CYAN|nr:type IV pilin-like G/H family protein [Lusitaniella coriacea]MBE9114898.1 type IV pilin-like G/H family protein [Lusitaniella coriacea LEGE 07157]
MVAIFKASLSSLVLVSSVGIGFAVLPTQSLALPTPHLAQAETDRNERAIAELLGEWQFPDEDQSVTLIFAPDNQLYILLPDGADSSIAIKMGYQVNATTQPMQLDVMVSPNETALTLFELTPDGKLRVNLDITPGDPRPESLGEDTALFDRVSDATQPPEEIEVIELEAASDSSPPSIPVQFISLLLQGQQAYFLENGQFAQSVDELGFATLMETEEYLYEIIPGDDRAEKVSIAGTPKNDELPSYTGAVFALPTEEDSVWGICRTEEPSTTPPLALTLAEGEIQCPSGSTLLP